MKTLKVIGNCCCLFLAIIGALVSIVYGYYQIFVKDYTTGTNYIGDQIPIDLVEKADDLTQEELDIYESRVLFNVNYYSNDKQNGIELQEMRLDYFTDTSLSTISCRSTGMQYIGDFETYTHYVSSDAEAQTYVLEDFYYYDSTNGISWDGGKVATVLNRNTLLTIKIDDKPYQIQLTGSYNYSTYERQWYTLWIWNKETVHTVYYDWGDVFADVMNAVKSNSAGYGDYYITLNLSTYFSVYEYDGKKFNKDSGADIVNNYAVLKFHYDENGARNSSQSMFGIIECNSKYDIVEEEIDTTYWQERMVYTLTEKDLSYRYSSVYDGYFVSLNMDTKKLFAEMPRTKVNVNLDLSDTTKKIVGLDYNAFEDFEIDTLTLNGQNQTFYILDKALYNSQLQTLKYTNGITLDIAQGAINNEFVEVVLWNGIPM